MTSWRLPDQNLNRPVWWTLCLLYFVQILLVHMACDATRSCWQTNPLNIRVATVLSESVLRARLLAVNSDNNSDTGLAVAQFRVSRVFKSLRSVQLPELTAAVWQSDLQCVRINSSCLVFVNISTSVPYTAVNGVRNDSAAPGRVSRLSLWSRRALKYVRMHICTSQYCIRRRPFVRLRHKAITVNEGRRVVFTCEADGMPLPVVFWTKNHVPLENSSHVSVQMKRHGSRLRIGNALVNDTGMYRCFAMNSVGRSRPKRTRVIVNTITSSCPANSQPCVDQQYCLNNGLCCQIDMLAVKLCQCIYPFTGERCSRKSEDVDVFEVLDRKIVDTESYRAGDIVVVILIIIVLVATAFLIVITVFAIRIHRSRHHHHHRSKGIAVGRRRGYRVDDVPHVPDDGWQFTVPPADVSTDAQQNSSDEDSFIVQAVVENDNAKWHDCGTVQLDNRVRVDIDDEHRHLSASPSNASICGSMVPSEDECNAAVISDVEVHYPSDADVLDVDDDHGFSPPVSRCGMSVVSGYGDGGDTSSWTQDDDDSASSSGNELLRRLEAYTRGDDESVDEFIGCGVIPSLEDFIAANSQEGDIDGSPI